jgi:tRNA 2-thiouridine synthesizing protein A
MSYRVTLPWTGTGRVSYQHGMEIDDELDATGLRCPLPVLKARKRLQALSSGAVLRVLADDPAAIIDMPHFCAEQGHQLVSSQADGQPQVYVIRKG